MYLSTYSHCVVQVQGGDDVGSARALLRLADHAAPHQSVQTWCVISHPRATHARSGCAKSSTVFYTYVPTRSAWDGAKLRPCLSVAARQLHSAELKVIKAEQDVKLAREGVKAAWQQLSQLRTTAAAATGDADVEITGCRSREQRDAEGFRNAQVLQSGDEDDGDEEERRSPLRPGGPALKRSRKK